MHSLFLALTATSDPSPAGTLRPGLEDQISPGIWGFLATAFVVVLSIFLTVDMVRRLRRVRYRTQVEEEREREAEGRGAEDHDSTESADGGATDSPADSATNGAGNGSAS